MSLRQATGTLLSITGTLAVTRMIGPESYGIFAAATAVQSYAASAANSGLEVSLIRSREEGYADLERHALAMVLILSLLAAGICAALTPWLAQWMDAPHLAGPGLAVFAFLPFSVIWVVPRARLSRTMQFGKIASIELASQVIGVGAALGLAIAGRGVWAPVSGWCAQQVSLTLLFYSATGIRVPSRIHLLTLRTLATDAWSFSASSMIWQTKSLINPLIVGHYLGPQFVGYAALCGRIVEALSFVRNATWHMMIAAFTKVRGDDARLNTAVGKATELQILGLAPVLVGVAIAAPYLFPKVMGAAWSPTLAVFPFYAIGALGSALFTPHLAALYVLGINLGVFRLRALQVTLIAIVAWIIVPTWGLSGIGWAEASALLTAPLFGVLLSRHIGMSTILVPSAWAGAACIATLVPSLGLWAALALPIALVVPGSIAAIRENFGLIRSMLSGRFGKPVRSQ